MGKRENMGKRINKQIYEGRSRPAPPPGSDRVKSFTWLQFAVGSMIHMVVMKLLYGASFPTFCCNVDFTIFSKTIPGAFKLKINKYAYGLKKSRYLIVTFPCLVKRGYFFETPGIIKTFNLFLEKRYFEDKSLYFTEE